MHTTLIVLMLMAPAPPSASPVTTGAAAVEELRRARGQLEAELAHPVALKPVVAPVDDELPRLKAAADRTPTPETLISYARALMAARRFVEARAVTEHATALAPGHAEASLTVQHLRRFDGSNGEDVVVARQADRKRLERHSEVAEARRTLPELAVRAQRFPSVESHLEHAAALVVLEEWPAAAGAAKRAHALDPKSRLAAMLLAELAQGARRPGEVVRQRITARWAGILTGKDPLGR